MNVLKNFEALFVLTLGLACAANYALDNNAVEAHAPVATAASPELQVVVVSAKRLSAEQKQQSLIDERSAVAANTATSKI
jgi:hypothetical protein